MATPKIIRPGRMTKENMLPSSFSASLYSNEVFETESPISMNTIEELALDLGSDESHEELALLPEELRPQEGVEIFDVEEMAMDIISTKETTDIVLERPTTQFDSAEIDLLEIEKKIINTGKGGNPLRGLTRDVLSQLPHLPYLAAIRDLFSVSKDEVKFTGSEEELVEKVLPILHRFPTEMPYKSPTGLVLGEMARRRNMVRHASVMQRLSATSLAAANNPVNMDIASQFYADALDDDGEEDLTDLGALPDDVDGGETEQDDFEPENDFFSPDDTTYVDNSNIFGNTDVSAQRMNQTVQSSFAESMAKTMTLSAADMANTKLAQFLVQRKASDRQASIELERQGISKTRIAKVLTLMAAYRTVSAKK